MLRNIDAARTKVYEDILELQTYLANMKLLVEGVKAEKLKTDILTPLVRKIVADSDIPHANHYSFNIVSRAANEAKLLEIGLPAYTTTPGWLGYTDEKMVRLAKEAVADGYKLIKLKCGGSLEDDKRRLRLAREAVGPDIKIAIDANQVWDVNQAIEWIKGIGDVNLHWVEEPTNPDDVLGHAAIAKAIAPVRVATGEHGMNRIIFKQMLQAKSFSFMQIDATRVAGVNENLANILMAAKFGVPVCPHAGGVGLCELVQHLAMFDAVAVTGHHSDRVVEFVDHLHEHFVVPTIIKNAHYMPPLKPGAGGEMYAQTISDFTFPTGKEWITT